MPFRPEDYADRPARADDTEEVYPDGTPRYECWNANAIRPAAKPKPKAPARRREAEEDREETDD